MIPCLLFSLYIDTTHSQSSSVRPRPWRSRDDPVRAIEEKSQSSPNETKDLCGTFQDSRAWSFGMRIGPFRKCKRSILQIGKVHVSHGSARQLVLYAFNGLIICSLLQCANVEPRRTLCGCRPIDPASLPTILQTFPSHTPTSLNQAT